MKFRKKSNIFDAWQWLKDGDVEVVSKYVLSSDDLQCGSCKYMCSEHGQLLTFYGRHFICPGDWIVFDGYKYLAYKKADFEEFFEKVLDD